MSSSGNLEVDGRWPYPLNLNTLKTPASWACRHGVDKRCSKQVNAYYMYTYTHARTHSHTHTHTCTRAYTHTHICVCTLLALHNLHLFSVSVLFLLFRRCFVGISCWVASMSPPKNKCHKLVGTSCQVFDTSHTFWSLCFTCQIPMYYLLSGQVHF